MDETTPLQSSGDSIMPLYSIPERTNDSKVRGRLLSEGIDIDGDLMEELPPSSSPQPVHHHQQHQRTMSLDFVMESLGDIKEAVQESFSEIKEAVEDKISEVKEVVTEVLEEEIKPVKPREETLHRQKLSALTLSILVFYKVSGGPFGCEPAVRAAGPFFSLLGFILFPLVWSLQEALVTAELGSAYPEPSGAIAWVEEAFGSNASLVCGYFHWVSGATDNAIYPSLFLEYVSSYLQGTQLGGFLTADWVRFAFTVVISTSLAYVSYRGLDIVGNLSLGVCVVSMSPFLLLCIFGMQHIEPSRWFVLPSGQPLTMDDDALSGESFFPEVTTMGVLWRPFLNSLFWNLNSFDVGASFAGEVQDPGRVFPRAMFLSVAFVWISYVLPLIVAIGASNTPQDAWKAGHLTVVAEEVVGHWLAAWTVLAAAVSNIALFLAEMSGDAYQLMGMADRGLIPKVFSKRSRFDTPTNGIMMGTMVIFCLSVANFDTLVEMLNFAYSFSLLLEFGAFVKLRITDDDVERPFRLPFGVVGCALFVLPSCFICVFIMITASKTTYVYVFMLVIFGGVFHYVQKAAHHYKWWDYVQAPSKKKASKPGEKKLPSSA